MPAGPLLRALTILSTLALTGLAPGAAQLPAKALSPDQLQEDFQVLRSTLEKAHAALYRYTPEEQMSAAFRQLESRLHESMSDLEFFRLLVPIIDLIHDAHTSIRPSRTTLKYMLTAGKVFPLDIRYVDGRPLIEKNLGSDGNVPVGAELLSINGRSMAEVTEKVLAVKSADGLNRAPKYEVANVNFWLHLIQMVEDPGVFHIEIREPNSGRTQRYSLSGVSAEVMQANQFTLPARSDFSVEFLVGGEVALMTIRSFGELALIDRFDEAFRAIQQRQSRALIIDLRDNGGGWDELNTELLSYLIAYPFRFYRGFTFRAKDWTDLKYVEYAPDDFLNMPDRKQLSEIERSRFVTERTLAAVLDHNCRTNPAAGIHKPKAANAFNGDLYLLINGRSQSSAGEIPAILHFLGVGTLIGDEPNAAYQGTTGGIILTVVLPHSGLNITLPLVAYENAVGPGLFVARGAPPHFCVAQTVEDAVQNRDTAMEFTLKLIAARSAAK